MSKRFQFVKYSGCGNDFIIVDNRNQSFPLEARAMIPRLCHRRHGIGADGLVLLELSEVADCQMRVFNSDGSEAEMCGNGLRCLALFFRELGFPKRRFVVEIMHRLLRVEILPENQISIEMGDPTDVQWDVEVALDGGPLTVQILDTGVPHIVLFAKDIDHVDMNRLAPQLRERRDLAPNGANVNFAMLDAAGELIVRTFERGVEGETLACGTGAAASAIAFAYHHKVDTPLKVRVRSGEMLLIDFDWHKGKPINLSITGNAHRTFQGECDLSYLNGSDLLDYTVSLPERIG